MKSIFNFFKQLFRRKKKKVLWDEDSLYDYFVNKYALSENGDGFYQAGKSIANFENSEAYVTEFINPLFDNIDKALSGRILQIVNLIDDRIKEINKDIDDINKRLDEKIVGGVLYDFDAKIDVANINEKEIESIVFPEKELQKMITTAIKKFEESLGSEVKPSEGNAQDLEKAIAQKRAFGDIKQVVHNFKDYIDSLSSVRHSSLHPPKRRYIFSFYAICLLLLCAEIGFSMSVVKGMVNPDIPGHPEMNIYLSVLYCIGIAASSAILMKLLIEKYLFKGKKRLIWFIIYLGIMFIILVVLFIGINTDIYRPERFSTSMLLETLLKSVMISAFSISFAMGNAFLFREATYLHHLHFRLYGRRSLFWLRIRRRKYVEKWEDKLHDLSKEKTSLNTEKNYYQNIESHVRQMFANLKKMSLASYKRGIDEMLADAIRKKDDLIISLMNKLKRKLK